MTKQEKVIECCRMLREVLELGRTWKKVMEHIRTRKSLGEDDGMYWNEEE